MAREDRQAAALNVTLVGEPGRLNEIFFATQATQANKGGGNSFIRGGRDITVSSGE